MPSVCWRCLPLTERRVVSRAKRMALRHLFRELVETLALRPWGWVRLPSKGS